MCWDDIRRVLVSYDVPENIITDVSNNLGSYTLLDLGKILNNTEKGKEINRRSRRLRKKIDKFKVNN